MTDTAATPEGRRLMARHVAIHTHQAVLDLQKALTPLQGSARYRDSALARTLRAALRDAQIADKSAQEWSTDERAQSDGQAALL